VEDGVSTVSLGITQYAANHGVTRVSSTLGMLLSAINADQFVSRMGTKSGTVRRGDFFLLDRSPGERFFRAKASLEGIAPEYQSGEPGISRISGVLLSGAY
jgi:hypothetical protein